MAPTLNENVLVFVVIAIGLGFFATVFGVMWIVAFLIRRSTARTAPRGFDVVSNSNEGLDGDRANL